MQWINYHFDDGSVVEIECSNEMIRDCARENLVTMSQSELIDFIIDNVPDDDLFDLFFEELREDNDAVAREIWRERR